jgi:hypothetical protein
MKVQLLFSPWYQTMNVDFPMVPEIGMHISLSNEDVNRYIAKVKAEDYPEEWGIKKAPNTIEEDGDGYWQDLYLDTQVVEVNIVWDDETHAYIPQAIIDVVDDDEEGEVFDED